MLNPKTGARELAYIVEIAELRPLEGYDRVEYARVNGWWCVVGKGMSVGDKAIYFEIDSKVNAADERFAFMERRDYKVKTQRMCKVVSQGLVVPLTDFPELANKAVGDFVTKELGVTYYEPGDNQRKVNVDKYKVMAQRKPNIFKKPWAKWLMRREWGKKLMFFFFGKKKDKATTFPSWVVKTDEERVQNVPFRLKEDRSWVITEKIDGSSATYTMKREKFGKFKFYVCSRNVTQTTPDRKCYYDTNVYWEMAKKYDIENVLRKLMEQFKDAETITIQGEVYGAGIQKRTYGLEGHDFAAFNFIINGDRWATQAGKVLLSGYGIPWVPVISLAAKIPETVEEMLEMATGESAIDGGMREGFVMRSLDGKVSFKAVSNEFLLKYH